MEMLFDILSVAFKLFVIPLIILVYKKKITFIQGLFLGTVFFIASFGCNVYSFYKLNGYSIIDASVNTAFDEIDKIIASMSQTYPADQISAMSKLMKTLKNVYLIMFPSLLVIIYLIFNYILFMIAKGILALFKKDTGAFKRFCDFKMAKEGIFFGIVAYLFSSVFTQSRLAYGFLNFSEIIFFATAVCGLSVVDYRLRKKIKISFLRFLIYLSFFVVLGAFVSVTYGILAVIGAYDAFFDIRNPKIHINRQN